MVEFTPRFLLNNPQVMKPVAKWCVALDNLELALVLVLQPWAVDGGGRTRAQLERIVAEMAAQLPLGAVYFQRISRAVSELERRGLIKGTGDGRNRLFVETPEGFAAVIINLLTLRDDPTINASEFEFRREIVAVWSLLFQRVTESISSLPELKVSSDLKSFYEAVDQVCILGKQVITPEIVTDAFSITGLINRQREHVTGLRSQVEQQLPEARQQTELMRAVDISKLNVDELRQIPMFRENPNLAIELVRACGTSSLLPVALEARVARYDAYLRYLDSLAAIYGRELQIFDFEAFRRRIA